MALRRGLAAVREAKATVGSGGGGARRFMMRAGESALVRFFGDFEAEADPIVATSHYVKRLQANPYHMCGAYAAESGEHAGCVMCYARENGDKAIGKSDVAFFYVKDYRKSHKFENEVRVLKPGVAFKPGVKLPDSSYDLTKYPPCKGQNCQFCRDGNEARPGGYVSWKLSITFADQLTSQQALLRDYCKCGARTEDGGPTIGVSRYLCGHCQETVDFRPEDGKPVARCHSCKQTLPPLEEIECTACGEPQRCDLPDFLFKVTRTGGGTDTSYNFEAIHPCKPATAEEMEESVKFAPNFEELVAPEPAELQARALGIPNPFGSSEGHGAENYASYEQTEEAAPPPKPAFKAPKPVFNKPKFAKEIPSD